MHCMQAIYAQILASKQTVSISDSFACSIMANSALLSLSSGRTPLVLRVFAAGFAPSQPPKQEKQRNQRCREEKGSPSFVDDAMNHSWSVLDAKQPDNEDPKSVS